MTSSEIAFLAIGLMLGAALGGALAQVVRARPARREVRLTIMPNAIPARHAQTLATVPAGPGAAPVPATPAAGAIAVARPLPAPTAALAALAARPDGSTASPLRTCVPSPVVVLPSTAVAVPVGEAPVAPAASFARNTRPEVTSPRPPENTGPQARAMPSTAVALALAPGASGAVAVLEAPGRPRPSVAGREAGARHEAFTTLVRPRPPVEAPRPSLSPWAMPVATRPAVAARPVAQIVGLAPVVRSALAPPSGPPPSGPTLTRPRASAEPPGPPSPSGSPGASSATGAPGAATDPCAGQRRAVGERCALADVAREQARRATDALREAQRAYDVLRDRVDRAEVQADHRQVAAAKERLHAAFRTASDRAGTADETEAAARAWLNEINALNNAVRAAQRIVEAGTAELRSRIGALERLSAEADAARIAGENAEAGCRAAREVLAGCEEADAQAREALPAEPEEPHPFARIWPEDSPNMPDRPSPADRLEGLPLIVRVLRGDRDARDRLVATLAAGDPEAGREWGLRVSRLADAIIGRAIEDGYLELPEDDAFWRLFSHPERRDIVTALSALGFRYDGLGGFADGRAPAARDLSLAVGYAGLDRMRIRTWPRDSEIAVMFERAVVSAAEWLADQADDLSLGRMVDALGNRAADLADVWNAWGRVRPALLST